MISRFTILRILDINKQIKTTQDTVVKEGITEHFVNYVSCRWTCTQCADANKKGNISNCKICKPLCYKGDQNCVKWTEGHFSRHVTFSFYNTEDPIEEFVDWILTAFDNEYDCVLYSHNGFF